MSVRRGILKFVIHVPTLLCTKAQATRFHFLPSEETENRELTTDNCFLHLYPLFLELDRGISDGIIYQLKTLAV